MNLLYLYLAAYIFCLLIISYIIAKKQTHEDFLISGRNRGGWQILASKFSTAIGVGFFISYAGFAYEYGYGVFTLLLGLLLGYLLYGYWAAPKIYHHSREKKFYTLGDFVFHRTQSESARKLSNYVSILILFGWLLVTIVGGGKIINDLGFMSYEGALIVTSLVVLCYILLAGFKAVIITDFIQSIIIVALLILVTFAIVGGDALSLLATAKNTVDVGTAIGFFLFGAFATFSYANMYQLCYASASKRKLIHGISLSVLPIILSCFFLLLIGVYMAVHLPGIDSGLVFTEALRSFLPVAIFPFGVVMFFAGVMSSADTNIYTITSHFVLSKKRSSEEAIKKIKGATILLIVFIVLAGLVMRDVVDISILAGGVSLILPVAMIYLIRGGKNVKRFYGSIVGGTIGLVLGLFILGYTPAVAAFALVGSGLGLFWNV